jgi:hypothetical protein
MRSEPAQQGFLDRKVLDQAESISVAALFGIPVFFSTLPAILFRVAAERNWPDPAAVFRAFAFVYFAFPLGYLVARGLRVPVVARIVAGLLVAALSLKFPAPLSLVVALLLSVAAAVLWVGAATAAGRRSRLSAQATDALWFLRHRRSRRWLLGLTPLVPLALLLVVVVAGSILLSSAERAVNGYHTLFASSREILAFDVALGSSGGQPRSAGAALSSGGPRITLDLAARGKLQQRIEESANDFAGAAACLLRLAAAPRRDRREGPPTAARADSAAVRAGRRDSAGVREPCVLSYGVNPRRVRPDSLLGLMGEQVHRAGATLDSLIEYATTAPDPATQQVDSIQRAAGERLEQGFAKRPADAGALGEIATFRNSEAARATFQAYRAIETKDARQKGSRVRHQLLGYQEYRLARARGDLAKAYAGIRTAYLRLFGLALMLLLVGLWMARSQRFAPRTRPVAGGNHAAAPDRSTVLADTYLLGVALVLLLVVPLIPKLNPANLDPRHPGQMFVQPGWYLPSFIAEHAKPAEQPSRGEPGGREVIYVDRVTGPDTVTIRVPSPPNTGGRVDSLLVVRLDSVLKVLQDTTVHRDTTYVLQGAAQDSALLRVLERMRASVDSIHQRVRVRPSISVSPR